MQEMKKSE